MVAGGGNAYYLFTNDEGNYIYISHDAGVSHKGRVRLPLGDNGKHYTWLFKEFSSFVCDTKLTDEEMVILALRGDFDTGISKER